MPGLDCVSTPTLDAYACVLPPTTAPADNNYSYYNDPTSTRRSRRCARRLQMTTKRKANTARSTRRSRGDLPIIPISTTARPQGLDRVESLRPPTPAHARTRRRQPHGRVVPQTSPTLPGTPPSYPRPRKLSLLSPGFADTLRALPCHGYITRRVSEHVGNTPTSSYAEESTCRHPPLILPHHGRPRPPIIAGQGRTRSWRVLGPSRDQARDPPPLQLVEDTPTAAHDRIAPRGGILATQRHARRA